MPGTTKKRGFGKLLMEYLQTHQQASTEELAKHADISLQQAYSRLTFMQSQEKKVVSTGKSFSKIWSLVDSNGSPGSPKAPSGPVPVASIFRGAKNVWKPSLANYQILASDVPVSLKTKVLVEYPEPWRDSVFAQVIRLPDEKGTVQAWDLRNRMYCYIPTSNASDYGIRVAVVIKEREALKLESV